MLVIKDINLEPIRPLQSGNLFPSIITIYSSGKENCNIIEKDAIDKSNNKSMFDGHFYIRTNGEIYRGRKITEIGEFAYTSDNVYDLNTNNIGICLEGDFNNNFMLGRQKYALISLIYELFNDYSSKMSVKFLREFDHRNNPGILLPFTTILAECYNTIEESTLKLGTIEYTTFGSRELAFDSTSIRVGTDIIVIQKLLNSLGYYGGVYNGKYDFLLVEAVKRYQESRGLDVNGICTFRTISKMKIDIASIYSNNYFKRVLGFHPNEILLSGKDIEQVQIALNRKNYKCEIDGVYTEELAEVVKNFQRNTGIYVDGKIGPITWNSILKIDRDNFRELYLNNPPFTGEDVLLVQNRLNELQFRVPVTGIFDQITETQIRVFQLKNNLNPTGRVTLEVFNLLFK